MNILILNWRDIKNPKSGGAEIVTMEHAKAWVGAGHSVYWFTSGFKSSISSEIINGINIIRQGNFLTIYLLAPFYYLFSKVKFDIVVDQIHGIPFFTPFYVRKPKIAFIHEVADEIWDYMFPFPLNKFGKFLEKVIFIPYKSIQFMTVSESTAHELKSIGIRKIEIVTNGLKSTNVIKFDKEKAPTFIFVSRIVKMKGIEDVINAFFIIQEKKKDARLWIVGEGDERYVEYLKDVFGKNENYRNIFFFGFVEEQKKLELMRRAHVILHASIKEGWGLVIIEAASQATPAIVYNVAGLRDSVKSNETGIVLEKNSPSEMARKAIELLENKKKYSHFQNECIKWAGSLTWEKSTQKSLNLLNRISK